MAFENRRQEGSPFTPTEEAWVQSGASGITILKHSAAPSGAAGYGKLYTNEADGLLYFLTAGGVSYNLTAAAGGDVIGPASSTDNAIVRFDSTTGKLVQNSAATVDDSGSLNIPAGQKYKIDGVALSAADVGAGTGDMAKATYDPTNKAADAFNTDNHADGTTNKVYTATEKTKLAGIAAGATVGADWNTNVANKPTLGGAASLNVGTAAGTVAAGDHAHAAYAPIASPTFTGGIGIGASAGAAQRILLKTLAAGASFGLKIEHDNSGNTAFGTYVTGDANMRFDFDALGKMEWGDGTNNVDTNLYRSGANALKTDDSLEVAGTLKVGTLTGVLRADTGTVSTDSDVTDLVSAASDTVAGKVELATIAETSTGTDASRAVTPDGLAGSVFGTKSLSIQVLDGATALATGNGKAYFRIPSALNGMNIVSVGASVIVKSTSGSPTVQISRGRQANATSDFTYASTLSTAITIDANEYDSKDAAVPAVIDAANDDLATGDVLRIDVTGAGTGTKGLNVTINCQLP